MAKREVQVRCEFHRNGLCTIPAGACGAQGRNRVNASSCYTDASNGLFFYKYHCPENLFSRTDSDGVKYMALVDDDEWPIQAKNPNILFLNRKRGKKKRQ